MKLLKLMILIPVLLSPLRVESQDISIKAGFDTSRIYIGDQTDFFISVEQPADIKLDFPLIKDTLSPNIEILSGPETDSSRLSDNRLRIIRRYLITSFDSGMYQVKPVYAELKDQNGIKRYYSNYSILQVSRVRMTPPDSTSGIFDIIAPYKAPVTFGEILPWIFIVLFAGLAVWALIRYGPRLKKKKTETFEPVFAEPAHVIAFRELEKIKAEELWKKGELKTYYTRLTDILRQYLENRFRVFSMELTTSETLEVLTRTGFKKDTNYEMLKSVLNTADLVKFAKYKPDTEENEVSFEKAWNFVVATKEDETLPLNADTEEKREEVAK